MVVAELICNRISGSASERGIRSSEVRFLMGTQNFYLLSHARVKTKNIFP